MIEHLLTPLISQRILTEEHYRQGHLRVINALNDTRIIGVHIPKLKQLAGELSKSPDAAELISSFESEDSLGRLCIEEKLLWGLMINALKATEQHKLALLSAFIPAMDNWAVCVRSAAISSGLKIKMPFVSICSRISSRIKSLKCVLLW